MSGKRVIRLGDSTSHGGVVVSASDSFQMFGKPVARMGDRCTCPLPGHGDCVIVEGDPLWRIHGRPVALDGHKLSCGGVVISSLPNVLRSTDQGAAPSTRRATNAAVGTAKLEAHKHPYDEQAQLDNTSIEGVPYHIETTDGRVFSGRVGANGQLPRIDTPGEDEYIVLWGDEALAKSQE